jgi:hypothetical protein
MLLTVVALMMVKMAMTIAPAFASSGSKFRACEQVAGHGGPHLPPFCP